ncbi:MAG TPA: hypothetical protein VL201_04205 [Patescibacteria group bacterium]|jgi:hypothetical protein|nr:hypothetical protein [Patescibacteria group bacterium]
MNYKNKFLLLIVLLFSEQNKTWALHDEPSFSDQGCVPFFGPNYRHIQGRTNQILSIVKRIEISAKKNNTHNTHNAHNTQKRWSLSEKVALRGIYTGLAGLTVGLWLCFTHK